MAWKKRLLLRGPLADFMRRYDALKRIISKIKAGQFIGARQIAFWLGPDVKRKLNLAKKREKLRLKAKPEAIVTYEIALQRADMMHRNTQRFVHRGKQFRNYPQKLQAHRDEATRLYQIALSNLQRSIECDEDLIQWLDRPPGFVEEKVDIRPAYSNMPRVRPVSEIYKLRAIKKKPDSRPNWIHLKLDLVQQEVDKMRVIFEALESALVEAKNGHRLRPSIEKSLHQGMEPDVPRDVLVVRSGGSGRAARSDGRIRR